MNTEMTMQVVKWTGLVLFGFFFMYGALIIMRGPSEEPPEMTCQRFCGAGEEFFLTEHCPMLSCTYTCTCTDGRALEGIR